MKKVIFLHDKAVIESFLRANTYLHIYSIGDLDDFFWDNTTWLALEEGSEIKAMILIYTGFTMPALLALSDKRNFDYLAELACSAMHLLPRAFYAHLAPGLAAVFKKSFSITPYGLHNKMALKRKVCAAKINTSGVVRIQPKDLDGLMLLYEQSYPGCWFDPKTLATGQYYGIKHEKAWVSVAGIHVFSPKYKVAASGNITTHPEYRGKGYCTLATAKLCGSLTRATDHIGLNVKADNKNAISCYKKLGFEFVAPYEEAALQAR
ncbi:GNAT family N-acetyltransferase [Elusimicrobiota bacterium]